MRPTMGKQGGPGTPDGHSKGQGLLEGQNNEDQVHTRRSRPGAPGILQGNKRKDQWKP